MRYASVCDGIGAAHVAWKPLGWDCAWTSEIEPFPSAVVDHHWKLKNLGDMTKLTEEMLNACGSIQLLVGGTPCQSFSVAGLRRGLDDPRGNLALRFTQLVGVLRPTWVVWENVPGVLSSAGGRDFGTFLGALAELGYGFAYRVLDAQWFGVAQRRRRVFVVAHARDWRRAAAVLFEPESLFGNPPTRGEARQGVTGPVAGCSNGGGANGPGRTADDADSLVLITQAFYSNESRCDNIPPPDVSPPVKVGSSGCGNPPAIAFAQNQREEVRDLGDCSTALNLQGTHQQTFIATPFTKAKRAQSKTDDESWVEGDVAPTQSCFDQGDVRATTVVAYDVHGTLASKAASETDVHTALRSRMPGQSEASTTTVVAVDGRNQSAQSELHHTIRTDRDAGDCIAVGSNSTAGTLRANPGSGWRSNGTPVEGVAIQGMAVRRLTPRECERLQGFPDDYTAVPYRGKPAADGPRYKALGNSMAVPVMAWIGSRIAATEATNG